MKTYCINGERITFFGRNIIGDDFAKLIWPYSGFAFKGFFNGGVVALNCEITDGVEEKNCMLTVFIDGEKREVLVQRGATSIVLAEVSEGEHEITVRKSSEATTACVVLRSLEFDGVMLEYTRPEKQKIEFIGDSISCGVGAFPEHRQGIPFDNALHCDAMCAFPALVSEKLGVDANVVAVAGWGVTRGSLEEHHRIPDIYGFTNGFYDKSAAWDFGAFRPDCVVIELGANDGANVSGNGSFRDAALGFLRTVRKNYPAAKIVWVAILITDINYKELLEAFELFGEEVKHIVLGYDSRGELNHPCFGAQREYAESVEKLILSVLE